MFNGGERGIKEGGTDKKEAPTGGGGRLDYGEDAALQRRRGLHPPTHPWPG